MLKERKLEATEATEQLEFTTIGMIDEGKQPPDSCSASKKNTRK